MEKNFVANRAMITINEPAFYRRTRSVVAGGSDV